MDDDGICSCMLPLLLPPPAGCADMAAKKTRAAVAGKWIWKRNCMGDDDDAGGDGDRQRRKRKKGCQGKDYIVVDRHRHRRLHHHPDKTSERAYCSVAYGQRRPVMR